MQDQHHCRDLQRPACKFKLLVDVPTMGYRPKKWFYVGVLHKERSGLPSIQWMVIKIMSTVSQSCHEISYSERN
jgi:hypothetical protein